MSTKISAFTAATSVGPEDVLAGVQAGDNVKVPARLVTSGLTLTAVKTANYTLAAGEDVRFDATTGSLTATLPTAPADKTLVRASLVATAAGHTLTMACGGSDVIDVAGGAASLILYDQHAAVLLEYQSAAAVWTVRASTLLPAGALGTAALLPVDTDVNMVANSDSLLATQKATRTYVQRKLAVKSYKSPGATAATAAALPACTATTTVLTASANGPLPAQDTVTLVAGDALLVKDQADATQNGIYAVTQAGDAGTPWILTRRTDANGGTKILGATITVLTGATYDNHQFTCTADPPIVVGTTALNWQDNGDVSGLPATSYQGDETSIHLDTATGTFSAILDTDGTMAADSDTVIPSQKAVKTYVDAHGGGGGDMLAANNLSDVADVATARSNLGVPAGSGTSTGTNTGDQTSVTGNAGTATALATTRTIDGVGFDGTADITVIAPATHAATSKTTPVDADELPAADSASGFGLAKLTWANIKAALKTYFDTFYAALSPSIQTVTSAATVTPTVANDCVEITAQAAALTIANPASTPINRHTLLFYILDNGTARAITWGSQYRGIGGTLPSTTTAGKRMYMTAVWNNTDSKYDVILPAAVQT